MRFGILTVRSLYMMAKIVIKFQKILIQAGGAPFLFAIQKPLVAFRMKKNCLFSGTVLLLLLLLLLLLYQFKKRVINLTAVIIVGYLCYQLDTEFYLISFSQG
jgi:hypothetical protein